MKLNFKKNTYIFLIILLVLSRGIQAFAIDNNFDVFIKLPLAAEVKVQEIYTKLSIEKNKFKYTYDVKPTEFINFFDNRVSSGELRGKIIKSIITPEYYLYVSTKEDFIRRIEFKYVDGLINDVTVNPEYDKSNLTFVSQDMIKKSIDPVTMFFILTNYTLLEECNKNLEIFDGKRRYNLKISDPVIKNQKLECKITQTKIAGYKKNKIKENKKYVSYIVFDINEDGVHNFNNVSLKENFSDLVIKKRNLIK